MRRWLLLLAPIVVVPFFVRWLVPTVGDRIARALLAIAPPRPTAAPSVPPPREAPAEPESNFRAAGEAGPRDAGLRSSPGGTAAPLASARPGQIVIPAPVVARALPLVADRLRSRDVVKDGVRGIELHGVNGLGTALRDGDIITSINGVPTPDSDAATAAGTAVLSSGRRIVRATIVRDRRPIDVTVELPPTE